VNLFEGNAVVEVTQGLREHGVGRDGIAQTCTGRLDQPAQHRLIERTQHAGIIDVDAQTGIHTRLCLLCVFLGTLLGALFTVEHISTGHFVFARSHQGEFDLVLDVFDVEGATRRLVAHETAHDRLGELLDQFAHARGSGAMSAIDGQEGLGHGHRDLAWLEADHGPIAADHLEIGQLEGLGANAGDHGQAGIGLCRMGKGGSRGDLCGP